ncbi:HAMP domain-containing protein, partial [Methylobacterium sp. J-070]|uniref:HAMP domain-containing protein n=1 Tax=Methylobacterium sp. J-070 TaxID=2836650 RepID=UPI001FBA2ABC
MKISTLILLATASICLVCAAETGNLVLSEARLHESSRDARLGIAAAEAMMAASTRISQERGPTNGALGLERPLPSANRTALEEARQATDDALHEAGRKASELPAPWRPAATGSIAETGRLLAVARAEVDSLTAQPLAQRATEQVSAAVRAMIAVAPALDRALDAADDVAIRGESRLASWLTIARTVTELRDFAGQIGSVFAPALVAKRRMTDAEVAEYHRLSGRVDAQLRQILLARAKIGDDARADDLIKALQAGYFTEGRRLPAAIVARNREGQVPDLTAQEFGAGYVPAMGSIVDLRAQVFLRVRDLVEQRIGAAWRQLFAYLLAGVAVLALCGGVLFLCIRKISRPIQRMATVMDRISAGDTDVSVPDTGSSNEIGAMARAVEVFKDNLIRTRALEAETAQARLAAEEQRRVGMRTMADGFEAAVGGIVGQVSSAA